MMFSFEQINYFIPTDVSQNCIWAKFRQGIVILHVTTSIEGEPPTMALFENISAYLIWKKIIEILTLPNT